MIARGLLFVLISGAALAAACGDPADPPFPEPPWPEQREPLPPCEIETPLELAEPALSPPSGLVQIEPSTDLVAVGVFESLEIAVLGSGGQTIDATAAGTLAIDVSGGELIAATAVTAGRATALIRLDREGVAAVDVRLESDGRSGRRELFGYRSQLPIWEIAIAEADLDALTADPAARLFVPAEVTIDGERHPVEMRVHGGSSRYYPKLSWRMNLDDGVTAAGQRHLILRAEYNDKTMLRNWAALDLIRNGSWLPAPRSDLVHLRINDRYYGVMNHVEKIDSDFLLARGLSPGGELFEADPPLAYAVPGGNLTPLPAGDYPLVYQLHNGGDYDGLIELIEGYLQLKPQTFAAIAGDVVAVDDVLVYLAMMAVIQSHDHVRKNYYLFRELGYADERWRVIPWDLELTFGHLWTEQGDVLDEQIFFDSDLFVGEQAPARGGFYNQLTDQLLADPELRARFLELVEHIASDAFDEAVIAERLENAVCRASYDILADRQKRASNDEYLERVAEITSFVRERRAFIAAELARLSR